MPATVGLTEPEARERFQHVTIYKTAFTPMRHALAEQGKKTAMKLVCAGEGPQWVATRQDSDPCPIANACDFQIGRWSLHPRSDQG